MHSARFERERLPEALRYFEAEGLQLIGRGAWRSALCPFHIDSRPSLRINMGSGAFRCMACGAKGGDVLAFHRARHGLSFVQAARDLGAWVAA
jgi:DNA primase